MAVNIRLSNEEIELINQVGAEFNNLPDELKTAKQLELIQLLADKVYQAQRPDIFNVTDSGN